MSTTETTETTETTSSTTDNTTNTPVNTAPANSILNTIKKRLGIGADYTHFDSDIIMDINSVFGILFQIGIGPSTSYSITDENDEWDDYISDMSKLEFVKTYVYLKVKLMFDPPQSSFVIDAINNQIKELEWRILVQAES